MTPICAKPRAAPPPSTRPMVGRRGATFGRHVGSYGSVAVLSATQKVKHGTRILSSQCSSHRAARANDSRQYGEKRGGDQATG